jgi:hypothetical protein
MEPPRAISAQSPIFILPECFWIRRALSRRSFDLPVHERNIRAVFSPLSVPAVPFRRSRNAAKAYIGDSETDFANRGLLRAGRIRGRGRSKIHQRRAAGVGNLRRGANAPLAHRGQSLTALFPPRPGPAWASDAYMLRLQAAYAEILAVSEVRHDQLHEDNPEYDF